MYFSIVVISRQVIFDCLQLKGLQHARLPCPPLFPGFAHIHVQ